MTDELSEEEKRALLFGDEPHAPAASGDWPMPMSLSRRVPRFPSQALGPAISAYVEWLAEQTHTPTDMAGSVVLATLAATVQGRAAVRVRANWEEPMILWFAQVMPPSSGKSPVFSVVTKPLYALEARVRAEVEELRRPAEAAVRAQELLVANLENRIRRNGDPEAVEELPAALAELDSLRAAVPAPPRLVLDDSTAEALVKTLAAQRSGTSVMSSEGGIFDTMGGRYTNGAGNYDVFLKGWSGEPYRSNRVGSGDTDVEQVRVNFSLAVQPSVLAKLGVGTEAIGRGLTQRFLFSVPRSNVGERVYDLLREDNQEPPVVWQSVIDGLDALLPTSISANFANVLLIRLSENSLSLFQDSVNRWEARVHEVSGDLSEISEWMGKLRGNTVRLAGLLHLLDRVMHTSWTDGDDQVDPARNAHAISAETHQTTVPMSAMRRAVVLAEYFVGHALAAWDLMGGSATSVQHLKSALSWVLEDAGATFATRELQNGKRGTKALSTATRCRAVLQELEEFGWVRQLQPEHGERRARGRPTERWEVNPRAREAWAAMEDREK